MPAELIFQPVLAMLLLTCVMTLWMFFTRIPTMKKMRIHPQKAQDTHKLRDMLPPEISRVSNNYNHLFEQPVVFYALAIVIGVLGHTDMPFIFMAWTYVALRFAHSIIQATIDKVMVRFTIFSISWVVLGAMVVREALIIF